jgi:hypothetical protein
MTYYSSDNVHPGSMVLCPSKFICVLMHPRISISLIRSMLNPKNSSLPVKIVWPPAQDPRQKVSSISRESYSLTIYATVVSERLLTNMKTSAQHSLDYDNNNYLVNVQKDCMRSSIPNKEMTIHRFFCSTMNTV